MTDSLTDYPADYLETPRPSRSPWQWLYRRGHRLRRAWYRKRARRLPRPVISVGNLHWGGAGKTPLVAAIARHLRDSGWHVAILSRGYRSEGRGVRIVSTGEGPLLGPLVAGDEPVLLAGALPGVAVVVDPDRYQAGRHALERLDPEPDLFLLDDGFSHLKLHRDLDLLVFPISDPFGGGRLPPGGRLREPLASAAAADAVLLSGGREGQGNALARALAPFGFRGPGFTGTVEAGRARSSPEQPLSIPTRVLLVCAIARPERFRRTVDAGGHEVVGDLRFPDHHAYPDRTLERIRAAFETTGAEVVLTTTKDRVKLHGRLGLPLADIPIRLRPEEGFWQWLDGALTPWRPEHWQGQRQARQQGDP
jgi:tetraacyldisaccharide 4'-kinase